MNGHHFFDVFRKNQVFSPQNRSGGKQAKQVISSSIMLYMRKQRFSYQRLQGKQGLKLDIVQLALFTVLFRSIYRTYRVIYSAIQSCLQYSQLYLHGYLGLLQCIQSCLQCSQLYLQGYLGLFIVLFRSIIVLFRAIYSAVSSIYKAIQVYLQGYLGLFIVLFRAVYSVVIVLVSHRYWRYEKQVLRLLSPVCP